MPLFRLSAALVFPPARLARADGLLCIGGDLSCERLILAYRNGIFPWFSNEDPLLWWSPDPRLVLFPKDIHVSRSLNKAIRKQQFSIRINTAFEETIQACAQTRATESSQSGDDESQGTWLVEEMIHAYSQLHKIGITHSVEAWCENELVGGLYGVSIGTCFFGESMFSRRRDASKVALVALARHLESHRFRLIDCQVRTRHLESMGATQISRRRFLDIIETAADHPPAGNPWKPGLMPDWSGN